MWSVAVRAFTAERDVEPGVGAPNGQPMHPFAIKVLTENGFETIGFESS